MTLDLNFYKGKTVLITGHTGFKGTWLCCILANAGAKVIGYSLEPPTNPNLFELSGIEKEIISIIGDIRDYKHLKEVFDSYKPEIVFHLAAQPIVRESYKDPRYTYETNVMGTVNVMECIRTSSYVRSAINITTDKVYLNNDISGHAFKEEEPLDGYDPYSNSKSCSELVTHSYKKAFLDNLEIPVSTARAGNVIGGGDFAKDRIIPDAVRAIEKGEPIFVRNPNSTRPYQHVFEPLFVYLLIAEKQYEDFKFSSFYNVGPDDVDCLTTGELINRFCHIWGHGLSWNTENIDGPHEANFLKLDCSKLKKTFGWAPKTHIDDALKLVALWTETYLKNPKDIREEMNMEIDSFFD
jgi:CDP-glucose 4,6-dehydratase